MLTLELLTAYYCHLFRLIHTKVFVLINRTGNMSAFVCLMQFWSRRNTKEIWLWFSETKIKLYTTEWDEFPNSIVQSM